MDKNPRLELRSTLSGPRYHLQGKPLLGGDVVALCLSGGWVRGRFEWTQRVEDRPRFHTAIELGDGQIEPFDLEIPERALVSWGEPREAR